ncbi:hypothetical protein GWK47_051690 [Chionoecetes opilio]|uniref:Uncharacterized protein n=1 Tax=Chionoecetes opilio TaxID=41210 RepID=A0A8J4Y8T3_CHIOP|nr:hypothetical protein GWK47_051690 [Chionoecetes opilio]
MDASCQTDMDGQMARWVEYSGQFFTQQQQHHLTSETRCSRLQPWQRSSNWSILLSNVLPQHLLRQTGSCVLYVKRRQTESLVCPVLSKRRDPGSGYTTMAANLVKFDELGKLPRTVQLQRLDEGQGVEATMVAHQAKWHKNMYAPIQ